MIEKSVEDREMDNCLIERIDKMIDSVGERLVADTVKYVNIKSVGSEAKPGAPFGEGAREVLDTFLSDAKADGLFTEDYGVGVVSAAMKERSADLGIWLHGDVVPEGDGWNFEPYCATEYKGCVIGRGATDNKGQLAAIMNLFRIFRELGVELKYNPAIYLGSNEETGMKDLVGIPDNPDARGFLNVCTPPKMSLVPDGGFPVGYGGKGGMNIRLKRKTALDGFTFTAGQITSPGSAAAVFSHCDLPDEIEGCEITKRDGVTEITSYSPPIHSSKPDPNGNMITFLTRGLLDSGIVPHADIRAIEFLRDASLDIDGKMYGIATGHDVMGGLTVAAIRVNCIDGFIELCLNIRYPLGITFAEIVERIGNYAAEPGFEVSYTADGTHPYLLDPTSNVCKVLTDASNSVTGEDKKPYTLSGGTYAHRLPNAYVYGTNGNLPPEDFPKGRGGAHGVDEAVSIERLKRAMRIYARAMLLLNEIEW